MFASSGLKDYHFQYDAAYLNSESPHAISLTLPLQEFAFTSKVMFPFFDGLKMAYEAICSELAFMSHNIVLTLQAMGLGGLYLVAEGFIR